MLEGEDLESRSVYACRLILAEAKLQQQAEKITELEKDKSIHLATMKGQIRLNEQLSEKLAASEAKTQELQTELLASKEALMASNKAIEAQGSIIDRLKNSKTLGDIYELKNELELTKESK
jgi:multidrug resistance efflux pump